MYKFKECRQQAGLSQKAAALSLHVKPPSISDWENGKTNPTIDNLVKMAQLYQVTVDHLLGVTKMIEHMESFSSVTDEKRLLDIYRQLNSEGQRMLIRDAENILGSPSMRKEESITAME